MKYGEYGIMLEEMERFNEMMGIFLEMKRVKKVIMDLKKRIQFKDCGGKSLTHLKYKRKET